MADRLVPTSYADILTAVGAANTGDTIVLEESGAPFQGANNRGIDPGGLDLDFESDGTDPSLCVWDPENNDRALVLNDSCTVNVRYVRFYRCQKTGGDGGGIYAYHTAHITLTLTNCEVFDCKISGTNDGGFLFSRDSNVTVSSCTISGCTTSGNGGFAKHMYSNTETVLCRNSVFRNCNCEGNGGAIYYYYPDGDLYISGCTASGIHASAAGGFLYFANADSNCVIYDSTFNNIQAGGIGGLMYTRHSAGYHLKFLECSFTDISSGSDGGVLDSPYSREVEIGDCTFLRCVAAGNGGAIHLDSIYEGVGTKIYNCTYNLCSATGAAADGGAIRWYDSGPISPLLLSGVTISGCYAGSEGGGANLEGPTTMTIRNVTVRNCKANDFAGGIKFGETNTVDIDGLVVHGCEAVNNAGGVHIDDNFGDVSWTWKNVLLASNTAGGNGGGLYIASTWQGNPALLQFTTFAYNHADGDGGGFDNYESSVVVRDSIFYGNTADGNGDQADSSVAITASACHITASGSPNFTGSWTYNNCVAGDPTFDNTGDSDPIKRYYLNQDSSNCVDAATDTAANLGVDDKTTNKYTSGGSPQYDSGTADIGYHYETGVEDEPAEPAGGVVAAIDHHMRTQFGG